MQISRYQTTNTCSRKPSYHQIIGYLLVSALDIVFFVCIYPNINNHETKIVLTIFISADLFVLAISCFVSSQTDPVDPVLITFLNGDRSKLASMYQTCLYCDTCNSYVLNTSRHCKICNRCVNKFDHHCTWINNCIGQDNYKSFMVMIFSAVFFLLIFVVSVILLWKQGDWDLFLPSMIVCWIHFALTIPFIFLIAALGGFHIYLAYRGLTTFQFITNKRQQEISAKKKLLNQTIETHNKTDEHLFNTHPTKVQVQMEEVIFQNNTARDEKTSQSASKKDEGQNSKKIEARVETVPFDSINHEKEMEEFYQRHKSLKLLGQSIIVGNLREGEKRMHNSNKFVFEDQLQKRPRQNQTASPPNRQNAIMNIRRIKISQLGKK